jgi:cytochrome c biogenesis protein
MRTALILLLFLAIGAAVGSILPQRPIQPDAVDRWVAGNPGWAGAAEKLGLFDVYGAWWFMTIYGLLLVSLVGCIAPRFRGLLRAARARPRPAGLLEQQPQYTAALAALDAGRSLDLAERFFRARRFRTARSGEVVAAEKGHVREGGSLLFHTAFLVLLLGVSLGKVLGFTGQVAIVEGERFTDTHSAYDWITEGRWFGERHRGFTLEVDEFDVSWWAGGTPREFVSRVRILDGGREVRRARIAVNRALTHRGVRVYQLSWGWAPRIRVAQRGKVLYDGPTVFLPQGGLWRGVVKLPQTEPQQVGLEMFFLPDADTDAAGNPVTRSPQARNPVLLIVPYAGDLNLSVPQSIYALDVRGLSQLGEGEGITLGGTTRSLPNEIEVSFPALPQYTVFQIASNPGAPLLLAAAVLLLVGLIPALYSSRRRVWVRAVSAGGEARMEIAGHALQRKAAFEEEFRAIVRDLDRELGAMLPARAPAVSGGRDG